MHAFWKFNECANFQEISDTLAHIQKIKSGGKPTINYLDVFVFMAICKMLCNGQVKMFMDICTQIGIPVSIEKTEWGSEFIVLMGLLIDARNKLVGILVEKIAN